jgi:Sulfotransferase domain
VTGATTARRDGARPRARLENAANEWLRLAMVHALSGPLPLYVVNEFPKSGGTWLGQMLARALDVPFPRNRFPSLRPSIMHGHYLRPGRLRNVVVVWRDGRDVMVSWYHQCLFAHDRHNELQVARARRELGLADYDDVRGNLPRFLEWAFTRPRSPGFTWSDFVRRWHGRPGAAHVRYEHLRANTAGELVRVVRELTGRELAELTAAAIAEEFSFERQAGRRPGEEDRRSFLRKGVAGDWPNYFDAEARQIFARFAGDALVQAEYEPDRRWVEA